jgi:uncharacterized repeat protein (TIGR02543 family)
MPLLAVCGMAFGFASCNDDDKLVAVESVALSDAQLRLVTGQEQALQAYVYPENATNKSIEWLSSDESVATVSENGEVQAIAIGTATIMAATVDGGQIASCDLTVQRPLVSVTGITLAPTTLEMLVGKKQTLVAAIAPADASVQGVTWTSSDADVASVDEEGLVRALSKGTTVIAVTTADGGFTATCNLSVDASEFTVTFESNGGEPVRPVVVAKGATLPNPGAPPRESGVMEGLYAGEITDPTAGGFTFDGWFSDAALTTPYDFTTPVNDDFTLYAKWVDNTEPSLDIAAAAGGNIYAKAIAYINAQSLSEATTYTLILSEDILNPAPANFNKANATLIILGKGEQRTISKNTNGGFLIRVNGGTVVLGDKVTLTGSNYGKGFPVYVDGSSATSIGRVIMRAGAKITGATDCTGNSAAVYVNTSNSEFIMEGGEITNNTTARIDGTAATGGAVFVAWGKFTMSGGVISGNKASTTLEAGDIAGGVYIANGQTFVKTGGVIEKNSASRSVAATTGKIGQDVLFWNRYNGNTYWTAGTLGETDNLSNNDTATNPLWQPLN